MSQSVRPGTTRNRRHNAQSNHIDYSHISYNSTPNQFLNDTLMFDIRTKSSLYDNADKIDFEIRTPDLHEKIQLYTFCGKAKIATLRGHKWLFESISTSLMIYDNMTQEQYCELNPEYFYGNINTNFNKDKVRFDSKGDLIRTGSNFDIAINNTNISIGFITINT